MVRGPSVYGSPIVAFVASFWGRRNEWGASRDAMVLGLLVASDPTQSTRDVIPFREIAKRPDFDAAKLAFFLLNPHPVMPNMGLSRLEAADLAAYIATLK